jgi:hypothetical protein
MCLNGGSNEMPGTIAARDYSIKEIRITNDMWINFMVHLVIQIEYYPA